MRPAFVVGVLYTESSGVARIVCDLANALARQGVPLPVYTSARRGYLTARHLLAPPNQCVDAPALYLGRLAVAPALRQRLHAGLVEIDVVHIHSLWMLPNHYGSAVARRHGKPVIFTAHGALEPWAVARSGWKKKLVGAWFQRRDLRQAACLHANSVSEIAGLRVYGLTNPVAVIPNGVDPRPFQLLDQGEAFRAEFPGAAGKRIALFLSRLHKKKGLEPLLEAWSRVARDQQDWHLVIVGPDDGLESRIRAMIDSLQLARSVTLAGPRLGAAKVSALAAADLFVLPSFSEGFSMAVLEAMAARRPVLITPGCHFDEVQQTGAGRIVEPTAADLETGLRDLMSLPPSRLAEMGDRGWALVQRCYTWDQVARQMLEVYHWMVGGGPMPSSIHCE